MPADPNRAGLPKWPAYSTDERATMIFDTDCTVASDPDADERRFWDTVDTDLIGL